MKSIMKIYILVAFALVYAAAAIEPAIPSEDLSVFDDDGNLVKLDPTEEASEPIHEIVKDLEKRVHFYLYTKKNRWIPEQLHLNDVEGLKNSQFSMTKETKFVTHGWKNSHLSAACVLVREAFLTHGDYNVIVVGWGQISGLPYFTASKMVPEIAKFNAKMIDFLESQGMNPSKVTIVGHSLGGHVAGLSSYNAKKKVDFVVALDPAKPLFEVGGPGSRVFRGDGKFVEIIHTCGGGLGLMNKLGDADFFPNGGHRQPGCDIDPGCACSHARSFMYYAESVNTIIGFVAKKCTSYNDYKQGKCKDNKSEHMGGVLPKYDISGEYYLNTHPHFPFAMGGK